MLDYLGLAIAVGFLIYGFFTKPQARRPVRGPTIQRGHYLNRIPPQNYLMN